LIYEKIFIEIIGSKENKIEYKYLHNSFKKQSLVKYKIIIEALEK